MAQQLGKFQYAFSTRTGNECVAHVLQALTERNSEATVLSFDGINAFDLVSRNAMLEGLRRVSGGDWVLSFVLMFPSICLWNDSNGDLCQIKQGEGGEQGDALMPLLFSLVQHQALEAVQRQVFPDERVAVNKILKSELWNHSRIRIHCGKRQVWNRAGVRSEASGHFSWT